MINTEKVCDFLDRLEYGMYPRNGSLEVLIPTPFSEQECEDICEIKSHVKNTIESATDDLAMTYALLAYMGVSGRLYSENPNSIVKKASALLHDKINDTLQNMLHTAMSYSNASVEKGVWTENVDKIKLYEEDIKDGKKVSSTNS